VEDNRLGKACGEGNQSFFLLRLRLVAGGVADGGGAASQGGGQGRRGCRVGLAGTTKTTGRGRRRGLTSL